MDKLSEIRSTIGRGEKLDFSVIQTAKGYSVWWRVSDQVERGDEWDYVDSGFIARFGSEEAALSRAAVLELEFGLERGL